MAAIIFTPLASLGCRQPHLVALPHGRRARPSPRPVSMRWRSPTAMASVTPPPGSNSPPQLYPGVYGPWSVDSADVREVVLYRAGLVTAATTFVAGASTALLPEDNAVKGLIQGLYDPLYVVGAGGLGASLFLIHIYVTPIKRTLQLLWAVGVLGSLGIAVNFAAPVNQGLVEFVLNNRAGIWAVGPLFASLTGLVFKEGLCYGKLEAAALFFVIPSLLLGRLSGVMDEKVQLGLLAAWMALFALFASRKFTQPIKDDIGDKSVFMFNALSEDEQQALLSRLQSQQALQKTEVAD
ncbi:hypothetical protein M758_2G211400 [Ceratodon purpureus]|nr:hypothetical protein M758_2G211400 [Ceratodon purpureus]